MKNFEWHIDTNNFIFNDGAKLSDNLDTKQFISTICKQIEWYSNNYTITDLKAGLYKSTHCHFHNPQREDSEPYNKMFQKLNTKLGEQEIFISPEDILQLGLENMKHGYRCYGYIIQNSSGTYNFHLFHLDPYHKIYPKQKKQT